MQEGSSWETLRIWKTECFLSCTVHQGALLPALSADLAPPHELFPSFSLKSYVTIASLQIPWSKGFFPISLLFCFEDKVPQIQNICLKYFIYVCPIRAQFPPFKKFLTVHLTCIKFYKKEERSSWGPSDLHNNPIGQFIFLFYTRGNNFREIFLESIYKLPLNVFYSCSGSFDYLSNYAFITFYPKS